MRAWYERVRHFLRLSQSERKLVLRRRKDHVRAVLLIGRIGAAVNRRNEFLYVSYVPDAIREHSALPHFNRLVDEWIRNNARRNAGDIPRLLFLVQNAHQVIEEGIEGDFAELGVHKGHSARVLADAIHVRDPSRRLYLFDTFGGFDSRDLEGIDQNRPKLYSDTSLDAVRALVRHEDLCDYRSGYFPDSAAGVPPEHRFALVHLDCDLYEPTRAALAFFYPRLEPGGLVVIHDYSSGHWPGVPQAVCEFLGDKPERVVLMPDKSGTAVFRKL
jgi:hypothetical protein